MTGIVASQTYTFTACLMTGMSFALFFGIPDFTAELTTHNKSGLFAGDTIFGSIVLALCYFTTRYICGGRLYFYNFVALISGFYILNNLSGKYIRRAYKKAGEKTARFFNKISNSEFGRFLLR